MQGVIFGEKHSYRNWGLMMKTRPSISPPAPKLKMIEIPGSDHVIDLTESLTGAIHYQMRTIHFEFVMMAPRAQWPSIYSDIMKTLHGRRVQIILDDDANYCYTGRVTVGEMEAGKRTAEIAMEAQVEPYKRERFGEGRCL